MFDAMFFAAAEGAVVIFILFAIGIVWLIVADNKREAQRALEWRDVARELDITFNSGSNMHGVVDGFEVLADIYTTGSGKNKSTWTRVRVQGGLVHDLSLSAEGFFAQLMGVDIKTGDSAFDDAVKVKGSPQLAMALLDAETREVVQLAVRKNWSFENGVWTFRTSGKIGAPLLGHIQAGLDLARLIRDGQSGIPRRLAQRVASDPNPNVRLLCLTTLIEDFARSPELAQALTSASSDAAPTVRLLAAKALGDLALLAAVARGESTPAPIRIEAFELLVKADPEGPHATELVTSWIRSERTAPLIRRAAIRALSSVPHPMAESILLDALATDDDDLRFDAIGSLHAVGTINAVPALIPHRDKLLGFRLKGPARDAILAIQARATGADAGALALAEDGGGLAVAEHEEQTD